MGLIQALHSLPVLVIGLLAGVWIDRLNVQRLLIRLDVIAAALIAVVPVAYWLGFLSIPMLYGLEFAWGFLSPFWWPAFNRFLTQVVSRDLLIDSNSMLSASMSATNVVGPLLAGALVQIVAAPVIVLVDSASSWSPPSCTGASGPGSGRRRRSPPSRRRSPGSARGSGWCSWTRCSGRSPSPGAGSTSSTRWRSPCT
jgi:hypothetical protein